MLMTSMKLTYATVFWINKDVSRLSFDSKELESTFADRDSVMTVAHVLSSPSQIWHSSTFPLLQQTPFSSRMLEQHLL
jgi:hypothetical protein